MGVVVASGRQVATFVFKLWLLVLVLPLLAAKPRSSKPWQALEARGAILAGIELQIGDVFDLTKPEEDIWLGRMANRLHATTRETVIRRVLLFAQGDRIRERRIYETERLLRALPFVKDAHIEPVTQPDGSVLARVKVRDAWTTQVGIGFAKVGGQRTMDFGVDEKNFLGTGKSVAYDFAKNHERSTWGLSYGDPQLFGSRWTLAAHTQYLTDGYARNLKLERPFFALDTPWSASLALSQKRSTFHLYDQGVQVWEAPFRQRELGLGWARALGQTETRVWRGGVRLEAQDTQYGLGTATGFMGSLPVPRVLERKLRGPALTLSTQKDAYESFQDLQGMDTPEDYNLAWVGQVTAGTYSRAWGSTQTMPFFRMETAMGWSASSEDLTLLAASWEGRKPASGMENSHVAVSLMKYRKLTANHILAGLVAVDLARRPDPERYYYLGGEEGLRGFPNQMHPGDARWRTSLDYRYLTEQRWWSLVRLGYSVFADVGAIRRLDGQGWTRIYSNVGAGLRLGNLKSSLGRVILLNVAVPLNREPHQARWQFTVGNAMRF